MLLWLLYIGSERFRPSFVFPTAQGIVVDNDSRHLTTGSPSQFLFLLKINSKDMRSCRHEDAVGMLTGGLSYVTLIVYREKVINKRMTPVSKLQDQSTLNKKLLIKNEGVENHLENGQDLDHEDGKPVLDIVVSIVLMTSWLSGRSASWY